MNPLFHLFGAGRRRFPLSVAVLAVLPLLLGGARPVPAADPALAAVSPLADPYATPPAAEAGATVEISGAILSLPAAIRRRKVW